MAEIEEFTTKDDLRAEAAELEGIAEELAEELAEFNRRKQMLEEKVGAAPFGTRAISEAAAALSDSGSLEQAQEALTELLAAVAAELRAAGALAAFHSGDSPRDRAASPAAPRDRGLTVDATELAGTGPVLEGVLIGHPTCQHDVYGDGRDCQGQIERVIDPLLAEVYGQKHKIDLCQQHLQASHADI